MTSKRFYGYLLTVVTLLFFISCENNDNVEETPTISTGVYVLNAGKNKSNNASITYYDFSSGATTSDLFALQNSRGLGDTGQDIIKYGSKLYISVYQSSLVEVVNPATCKSLKSIPLTDAGGNATKPRSLACANGKIYIVLYSGSVAELDTTTLSVDKTISVGANPNKSVIVNNKLYVGNSGGAATVKDSTVSVINLSTFTEEKKIVVGLNPFGDIGADSQGDVYVLSKGNYKDIPARFQRIEAGTNKVTTIDLSMQGFAVYGDKLYSFDFIPDSNSKATLGSVKVAIYDLKNEKLISSNIIDSSLVEKTPYAIGVDPTTNNVYLGVTDYVNAGTVYCFGSDGSLKYTFTAGINPCKFFFLTNK
jgi:YVTN family beta-propeller protein